MARGTPLGAVFALIATMLWPSAADACSCASWTPPLCESFWRMDAVFVGEVAEISEIDIKNADTGNRPLRRKRVKFRVERSFRGPAADHLDVHTGMGGGDCGYAFTRGQKYLVFASNWNGGLSVSVCGPTQPLSAAGRTLADLTEPAPARGGRIYGTVQFRSGSDPARAAANYTVTLRGGKEERTTATDAAGKYEFDRIPVGTYSVHVAAPAGMMASVAKDIDLRNVRGCALRDLVLAPDGRVVVRLAVASGALPPKVEVELIDAETLSQPRVQSFYSEEEGIPPTGIVHWRGLPPGRYVLGVNITRPASTDNPYTPTFFPGVRDVAAAQVIELGFGQHLELPLFTLPEPPMMLAIRGSIVRADSRAVGGISVFLDSAEPYSRDAQVSSVQADRDGRFVFMAPAGSRYRVYARWNDLRGASEPFELTPATAPVLIVLRK